MLDVGATVSALVFREMLVTVALNAIISLPVFWICRRILRPALAVDPIDKRRRRQGPARGGPARPARAGDLTCTWTTTAGGPR